MAFCYLQSYKANVQNDLLFAVSHGENEVKAIGFTILGYAFENVIKSELARQLGSSLDESDNLQQLLRGHELKLLHQRAFPSFSDDVVLGALAELSKFTIWAGRYSVPLFGNDYEVIALDSQRIDVIENRYKEIRINLLKEIRPEYYPS